MPDLKKMLTLEALSEALPSWLKRDTKPEYNADEIDSTNTINQFVSDSDKDNWNAKGTYSKPSGGIPKSDLSSIVQTSLEKADSALQSETDPTVPSWAKQSSKPSYTQDEVTDGSTYKRVSQSEKDAWSGKQNALTTTQMQAVNSGITSAGVAQIFTNQSEIELLEKNAGGKNLFDISFDNVAYVRGQQYSLDGLTGTVSVIGDGTLSWSRTGLVVTLPPGTYVYSCKITTSAPNGRIRTNTDVNDTAQGREIFDAISCNSTGTYTRQFTLNTVTTFYILFYTNFTEATTSATVVVENCMICKKTDWDISQTFQPHALPNAVITPALIEQVDGGAKNLLDVLNRSSVTTGGITCTFNSDGTITLNGTATGSPATYIYLYTSASGSNPWKAPYAGVYVMSCEGATASDFYMYNDGRWGTAPTLNSEITLTKGQAVPIIIRVVNGKVLNNANIKPMICTLADWNVSQKFVPFAKSNKELTDLTSGLLATTFIAVQTANNYVSNIEGGYIRIGNLVIVNIRCTVNIAIPTSSPFISGLPYPIIQYGQGYGGASVTNNRGYNMTLIGTGSIAHSEADPIPVNTTLIMSTAYFAK